MSDPRQGYTSASNAEADYLCPGRHLAQKGIPEEQSGASDFGNALHAAFEGREVSLDRFQEKLLQRAREREKQVLELISPLSNWVVSSETRVWAEIEGGLRHSGQFDKLYVACDQNIAVIEDLKSLQGDVEESPSNRQLRDLAALVWSKMKLDTIYVFINQPMVRTPTVYTKYTRQELNIAFAQMVARVVRSNTPGQPRVAGAVQCLHCRARGTCPEAIAWAQSIAHPNGEEFPALTPEAAVDMVKTFGPDDLAAIFAKIPTLNAIMDAVKDQMMSLTDEQLEAVGYARKKGHFTEKVNDPIELSRRIAKVGVPYEAIAASSSISKDNLEKLLRSHLGLKGEMLVSAMKGLLDGIVDKKQTSDRLVKIK